MMKKCLMIIPILVMGWSCTRNFSEVETMSISGTVKVKGVADLSGIKVSVYQSVAVDTVSLNLAKYVSISQNQFKNRLFDHRTVNPLFQTQTDDSGFYQLIDLPEAEYTVVIEKNGYGWRYLHNVFVTQELPDVTLLAELRVAGVLDFYTEWPADQHIIVLGDIQVPYGGTLLIDKGATIRFDGFFELVVNGQMFVNGIEEHEVVFTTNRLLESNSGWKSLRFAAQNQSSYTLQNCIFQFCDTPLRLQQTEMTISQCTFGQVSFAALLAAQESNVTFDHNLVVDCLNGAVLESKSKFKCRYNFITGLNSRTASGIKSNSSDGSIEDNVIFKSQAGLKIEYGGLVTIQNNLVSDCDIAMDIGSTYIPAHPTVSNNTLKNWSTLAIQILGFSQPRIHQNNIIDGPKPFLRMRGSKSNDYKSVDVSNNYWGTKNEADVREGIEDKRADAGGNYIENLIIYLPVRYDPLTDCFPR